MIACFVSERVKPRRWQSNYFFTKVCLKDRKPVSGIYREIVTRQKDWDFPKYLLEMSMFQLNPSFGQSLKKRYL